jgi:hypothetical protein
MKRRFQPIGAEKGSIAMRWATRVHYEASRRLIAQNPSFRRLSVEAQAVLSFVAWRTLTGDPASAADVRKEFPAVPESTIRLGVQRFLDEGLLVALKDSTDARKTVYVASQHGKELYQLPCDELFQIGMSYAGELAKGYAAELAKGEWR